MSRFVLRHACLWHKQDSAVLDRSQKREKKVAFGAFWGVVFRTGFNANGIKHLQTDAVSDGERLANGHFAKGNRVGSYSTVRRQKEALWSKLPLKALQRYDELLDCGIPPVVAAVAKDILDREYGKPRQMAQVDVRHTDMTALHLAALKALADRPIQDIEIKELPPIVLGDKPDGA